MSSVVEQHSAHAADGVKGVVEKIVSTSAPSLTLIVRGGAQSGARMNLMLGRGYTVGANINHDIVLRDAVLDGSHLRIVADRKGLSVSHINGAVQQTDDNAQANQDHISTSRVNYRDEIAFGSASLFVVEHEEQRVVDSSHTTQLPVSDSHQRNAGLHGVGHVDSTNNSLDSKSVSAVSKPSSITKPQRRVPLRPAMTLLRVGGLSVIGFAVLAFTFTQFSSPPTAAQSFGSIEMRLLDANLPQLTIDSASHSPATIISGYVQSRDQALRLAEFIALQPEPLINQVVVDEEIRDQILDVLRVSGITGSIESLGQGAFVAHTQLPDGDKLDRLQGLIERDVPSVASFTISNLLPDLPPPAIADIVAPPKFDAGKRVVMVNSDAPAYVVTEDQSRYFVGALLPGGYRISAIADGRVTLERLGVKTELKF